MKEFSLLHELKSDLGYLYTSLPISPVEDLYIKVAQSLDESFFDWLLKGRYLKKLLQDPFVYDALKVLVEIRQKYPSTVSPNEMIRLFMGNRRYEKVLPTILDFNTLLSDPQAVAILNPFRDIISAASVFQQTGQSHPDVILSDLAVIKGEFSKYQEKIMISPYGHPSKRKPPRETKKQKQLRLLTYLLQRATDDVASAAREIGFSDVAGRVQSEALLLKPDVLSKYLPVNAPNEHRTKRMEDILKDIMRRTDEAQRAANYEYLKSEIMRFEQVISTEEYVRYLQEREKQFDAARLLEEGADIQDVMEGEDLPKVSIATGEWLRPDVLASLTTFFLLFLGKIRQ